MIGRSVRTASIHALAAAMVVTGAAAAAGPATRGDSAATCDRRCVLVVATRATSTTYKSKIALTGGIEPKFSSNIAFRINGKISRRLVEIGEHVDADQVLATLDPRDQQSNVDTARAGLVSAQALLVQTTTAFQRQVALFKSGYTTRPAYDQAEQQLRTQQAAVESAKAAVGTAEEQLGYAQLKPGVSGIITARNAEAGQVVQAGQTVFTLAQDGPRDAVFDIYEALLTEKPGGDGKIDVFLQTDPTVATTGHVREISPTVDPASGAVKVKVGLDTTPQRMSLGAPVVGVGTFKPRSAIVLPRGALFRWQDAPAVWLLDLASRRVEPRVVTVDRYTDDELVLAGGVAPGDVVVTAGIQFLHPGQVVGVARMEPSNTEPSK